MDDKQLVRYMLMGFFLHYRAANHAGDDFDTIAYGEQNPVILSKTTIQKFQTLNKYLDHPIEAPEEYLR